MTPNWEAVPIVEVTVHVVLCPECGHDRYVTVRSADNLDGTSTAKTICKRCSARFLVVREYVPCRGNSDLDIL